MASTTERLRAVRPVLQVGPRLPFVLSPLSPVGFPEAQALVRDLVPPEATVLKVTGSLCPDCVAEGRYGRMVIPMAVYEHEGAIRLAKRCDEHGVVRDVYWSDAALYHRAESWRDDTNHLDSYQVAPPEGVLCPTTCGLCPIHKSHTGLGNITVTNRCDLSCWYCFFFAHEDDPLYEPSLEEIETMARTMAEEQPIGCNAIQITGGEPTIRSDIVDVVKVVAKYVDHVQLNTHSGLIGQNVELARELRAAGVNTVYTSFDGVDWRTNPKNYMEMPDALRTYRDAKLAVVLVPTIIGGRNLHQVGDIVRFAAAHVGTVRGVNFQPVSLVGRMPTRLREKQRVTIPDVVHALEEQTDGAIPSDAWYPIPSMLAISDFAEMWRGRPLYELSNHFACGLGTYVYRDGENLVPITSFLEVEPFLRALEDLSDRFDTPLRLMDRARIGLRLAWELHHDINRKNQPQGVSLRKWLLESLTRGTYEGLVKFHENALFIGMMHFMDPYNYDVDRVERCDIHYAVPDGRVIPFCAYNVVPGLYRDRVNRTHSITVEDWLQRDYAKLDDAERPGVTRRQSETITLRAEDRDFLRDGPGVYGYDLKRKRRMDEDELARVDALYRRAIDHLEPV